MPFQSFVCFRLFVSPMEACLALAGPSSSGVPDTLVIFYFPFLFAPFLLLECPSFNYSIKYIDPVFQDLIPIPPFL